MKKVIWLFGQPGAGRQTLMDSIGNKDENVCNLLNIENANVGFGEVPYDRGISFRNFRELEVRRNGITLLINDFLNKSDKDTLIFKGEFPDYAEGEKKIIDIIKEQFPEIENEIVILNPSDLNAFYERIKQTEWFKGLGPNTYKFPIDWLKVAEGYMVRSLKAYEDLGIKVYDIDTLNGYKIVDNQEKVLK